MSLNGWLAENWTPLGIWVIGLTSGITLLIIASIWFGASVPKNPRRVLLTVFGSTALVFLLGSLLATLNDKRGGTGWGYKEEGEEP